MAVQAEATFAPADPPWLCENVDQEQPAGRVTDALAALEASPLFQELDWASKERWRRRILAEQVAS